MFPKEYEKGVSFQYLIDTLQLDGNVNTFILSINIIKPMVLKHYTSKTNAITIQRKSKIKEFGNECLNSNQINPRHHNQIQYS